MAKALIVSGDEGTRYLYEVAIAYQKIEIETADTLSEAVKTIAKDKPDLVILDILTPDFDNVNLLKELKNKVDSLPVIILADMKNSNRKKEASILGACKYMVKGESSLGDLIRTVRKAVKKD